MQQDGLCYGSLGCCFATDEAAITVRIRFTGAVSGSFHSLQTQKKPIRQDGLLHLFDAWQFMAGVLPATLRAVAAQRSNPLPADLSSSGEHSPTDHR
ncbi:hypothetical protein C3425_24930 [Citrobacter braakii]|nr:hypothetical protein C3423_25405 [Citrobacter braakii]POT33856.1 hypothetical protein C3431_24915 [Citrobacter braakii]POT38681.1 hypothetical protein C3425_24930 [Citrobacter braakii]POT58847.1 hypothetical protein C3428_24725 [Citrobacter braakii]POU80192.1 hypothetical protein C3426_25425 [Citrobacter braakii]